MRFKLKQRTAIAHQRLDTAISRLSLAQRRSYGVFLRTHEIAYCSLLKVVPDDHWMADELCKGVTDLQADLTALCVDRPYIETLNLDAEIHPLGVAYVVTGSHFFW